MKVFLTTKLAILWSKLVCESFAQLDERLWITFTLEIWSGSCDGEIVPWSWDRKIVCMTSWRTVNIEVPPSSTCRTHQQSLCNPAGCKTCSRLFLLLAACKPACHSVQQIDRALILLAPHHRRSSQCRLCTPSTLPSVHLQYQLNMQHISCLSDSRSSNAYANVVRKRTCSKTTSLHAVWQKEFTASCMMPGKPVDRESVHVHQTRIRRIDLTPTWSTMHAQMRTLNNFPKHMVVGQVHQWEFSLVVGLQLRTKWGWEISQLELVVTDKDK